MRFTRLHAPTLKEVPNDAEVVSHQLLVRAGYIRKLAAGIYDFLPLATRVIHKICGIVREEMTRALAQEVSLPAVQPAEIWEESGRWGKYGPELLRFKDRKGGRFCLGPTHEEVIVDLVRRDVRSWRDLPLNLFQIQSKFRDEIRPRAGLMRGREFLMKDAYSFDVDEGAANRSYDAMFAAYERIFKRCGLDFRAVEADTGAIGGNRSHEFQVLADSGEDAIVSCSECSYAANVEQAELPVSAQIAAKGSASSPAVESAGPERVHTPDRRTIEEVAEFLGRPATDFVKSLVVNADGRLYMVLVRGDHELNEIKVKRLLNAVSVELASDEEAARATGAPVGFAGPVGLTGVSGILADHAIQGICDGVTGANEADYHLVGLTEGRDFEPSQFADLRMAQADDPCPRCGAPLRGFRGIEVGHVFFLGSVYSAAMRCGYLDEGGAERPMVMGCYGIGITRIASAAIEQNHDQNGIVWPMAIAPYHVIVLPLQMNVPEVVDTAERVYDALVQAGIEVLLDDRRERAGAKFKDADLLGIPLRIAVGGRGIREGVVELKPRTADQAEKVPIEPLSGVVDRIRDLIQG